MGASTESASKRKKNGAGGLEGIASRTIVAPSLAEHKPGDGQDGAEIFGRCQRPSAPIVGISTSIRRTACLAGLTALGGRPRCRPHHAGQPRAERHANRGTTTGVRCARIAAESLPAHILPE